MTTLYDQKLNVVQESFLKEQNEIGIAPHAPDVRLVLGISIQHVLMSDQYRTISIRGPLHSELTNEAIKEAEGFGAHSYSPKPNF